MTSASYENIILTPLSEIRYPKNFQKFSSALSANETTWLSKFVPKDLLENNKDYDVSFDIFKSPIPLAYLAQVFKLARNRKRLMSDLKREKLLYETFSEFCFINKEKIPFTLVKKIHDEIYGHGLFHVFKHAKNEEDVLFLANLINSISPDPKPLVKSLVKASLSSIETGKCGIVLAQKHFTKDEILDEIIPQIESPELLTYLFDSKFLIKEDAVDPRLLGPFIIRNKDNLLNILCDQDPEGFLPALIRLHHQKTCFPLPYISNNLKKFQTQDGLVKIIGATKHRWVSEICQKNFDENGFVSFLEKALMQKETLSIKEGKKIKQPQRKM